MIVWRGSLPALIYLGGHGYMESPSQVSWSPTTTQSGSFLCTAASSTPIRVVTKEVKYIHELSLTLEYSTPVSSPAVPGLTGSWSVATLFACPSTTTSGACDHKLANNSNAAHMDPIIKKILCSLKSVEQYFTSGRKPVGAHVPMMSATDIYFFDRCTYMVILLPL